MQLLNGIVDLVGLWLGHLIFDSLFTIFIATAVVIIFSAVTDYFWRNRILNVFLSGLS